MKKTFLSLLMAGCSLALFAQTNGNDTTGKINANNSSGTTNNSSNTNISAPQDNNMMNSSTGSSMSNSNYSAFGAESAYAPANIQSSFMRDYPTANNVKWQQNNNWWHASYSNNGRTMSTYYNVNGTSYSIALPVIEDQVPADVVSMLETKYNNIYDITQVKGANDQPVYVIRLINNGEMITKRLNADGSDAMELNSNTNSNNNTQGTMNDTNNMSTNGNITNSTSGNSSGTMNNTQNNDTQDSGINGSTDKKSGKNKIKTKITTSDGNKQIIKTKNGKTYTKNSSSQDPNQ